MAAIGATHDEGGSPFARAARDLVALGYHVVPIIPPGAAHSAAGKAPGKYSNGAWQGFYEWERLRDRPPTEFELKLWSLNFPDANIGIVCGSHAADGLRVIAIDIDTDDFDEIETLLGALPKSMMSKRGGKGQTLFYAAPPDIESKSYDRGVRPHLRRMLDLITGNQTRQTVAPPSAHALPTGQPSGMIYRWLSGPVPADQLTVFDHAAWEKLEDTLRAMGWNPEAQRRAAGRGDARPVPVGEVDDIWSETKIAALQRLDDWVPALDLYGLERARGGYAAVATWRSSTSGRALELRKRNLSIQPGGIKDFGTNDTYSALDLVVAARGGDLGDALAWLRGRLGFDDRPVFAPALPVVVEAHDPVTGEIIAPPRPLPMLLAPPEPLPAPAPTELPEALTRLTGLLGAITDWICDTSRQPHRSLALGAALTVLAGVAGRKYGGPTLAGGHLYILGVAKTAAGKDHPLKQVTRLVTAAGLSNRVGLGRFTSEAAVYNRLLREPVTVATIDELGKFMKRITSPRASTHEEAISGALRTFWSANFDTVPGIEYVGRSSAPIHSPALSIFGVSTPEEFYASLKGDDVLNGFLNRFLLLSTSKRPPEIEPQIDPYAVPGRIIIALQEIAGPANALHAATMNSNQADGPEVRVPWGNQAAHDRYMEFGRYIKSRELDLDILSRAAEMAVRIALLKAIGDDPLAPKITEEDIVWAQKLVLWSGERMLAETRDYISDNEQESNVKMMIRAIKKHGQISKSALWTETRKIKPRDRAEIIKSLIEEGAIDEYHEKTAGRDRIIFTYKGPIE